MLISAPIISQRALFFSAPCQWRTSQVQHDNDLLGNFVSFSWKACFVLNEATPTALIFINNKDDMLASTLSLCYSNAVREEACLYCPPLNKHRKYFLLGYLLG